MKNISLLKSTLTGFTVLLLLFACNTTSTEKPVPEPAAPVEPVIVKPDMAAVKAEIQAAETAWAAADNARNVNAIMAFYSNDAISLSNNAPMLVGKTAIQKDYEEGFSKKAQGTTVTYDVLEVFGDENTVTEIGKATTKDASEKIIRTGKYMAIWEKRDGKYVCIRDIYNDDVKQN